MRESKVEVGQLPEVAHPIGVLRDRGVDHGVPGSRVGRRVTTINTEPGVYFHEN